MPCKTGVTAYSVFRRFVHFAAEIEQYERLLLTNSLRILEGTLTKNLQKY